MELRQSYFEQYVEPDHEYIHLNDHLLALSDIEADFEQLIAELYDECEQVDNDVVHSLVVDICKKLEMKAPDRDDLNIQKVK